MCKAVKTQNDMLLLRQEFKLARCLLTSDEVVRKKALKTVKKWFLMKSRQNSSDLKFSEEGLLKIWKGLFYCVWTSNLSEENDVIESICSLIRCFTSKDVLLFCNCFLHTLTQAWFGFDLFTVPKFIMLVRRFLCSLFEYMSKRKWASRIVEPFNKLLYQSLQMFPLALNLHLIEYYLEGLAKVGGSEIKAKTVLELIKPFADFMADTSDPKILDFISKYVFLHLLAQSEEGTKAKTSYEAWELMGFPDGDVNCLNELMETAESDCKETDKPPEMEFGSEKDPVDEFYSSLPFDAVEIKACLRKVIRKTEPSSKTWRKVASLYRKFHKYIIGSNSVKPVRSNKPTTKWEISSLQESPAKHVDQKECTSRGFTNSGNWEVESSGKSKKRKSDLQSKSNKDESPPKKQKMSGETQTESSKTDTDMAKGQTNGSRKLRRNKSRKCDNSNSKSIIEVGQNSDLTEDSSNIDKNGKTVDDWTSKEWDTSKESETEIVIDFTPPTVKSNISTKITTSLNSCPIPDLSGCDITPKNSPGSARRVEFVLKRNTFQEVKEYRMTLKNSPNVPWSADKKPKQGVLKPTPVNSPINPFYKFK